MRNITTVDDLLAGKRRFISPTHALRLKAHAVYKTDALCCVLTTIISTLLYFFIHYISTGNKEGLVLYISI